MEAKTRKQAVGLGLSHFYTGVPCRHGHLAKRRTSNNSCCECERLNARSYRAENPNKSAESVRAYRQKNAPARAAYYAERYRKNKDRLLPGRAKYSRDRYKADPVFAMASRARGLVKASIRNGGYEKTTKTSAILGCDWQFFKRHIELQFLPGMTWENRSLWHIDHILPIAGAKSLADVVALNHFTNLRPLWSSDNRLKAAQVTHLL